MGYDLDAHRPVWRLEFADHPGLILRVRAPGVAAQLAAEEALPLFQAGENARAVAVFAGPFADAVISWTLYRAGRPVPVTRAGVLSLDLPFALMVMSEWMRYAFAVAPAAEVEEDESGLSAGEARLLALAMPPLEDDADGEVAG